MAIRSSVKTIVVKENRILLVKYIAESGFVHYELPRGGQNQFGGDVFHIPTGEEDNHMVMMDKCGWIRLVLFEQI